MNSLPRTSASLRLRHFVREDAPAIMELNAEPSTRRWLPSHVYPTVEDAHSALDFLISSYVAPGHPQLGPYVLAVDHRDTGRLLGHVGFSPLDSEIEVSYAIAESFRGRGYGVESLTLACNWINSAFAVSRVLALTASANMASCRTLERASFVYAQDEDMLFQGVQETVSRYWWRAPDPVAIRVASDSDVPGIRAVIRSAVNGIAFRDYPPEVLENWGADTPEASTRQRRAIQDSRELTWVAIAGDAIVGFSALDPQSGEVRAVYVAAHAARRGVGSRLLMELESTARALGLSRLTLDSSITAEPFYRNHGYVSIREHVHTLRTGVGMRAIQMAKELAQVQR